MIDTSENLIIIKGQIKTAEIESCQMNANSYSITFCNSPSTYSYKEENVIWLTQPDKPDPNNYQIASKGRILWTYQKWMTAFWDVEVKNINYYLGQIYKSR